jgi:hypothetical protein
MPMMTGYHFFLLYMGLVLATGMAIPLVLFMHFFMPDAVLERYWKQPYMRPAELALFTNTIYAPMRTAMLMWAIAFPRYGKKRDILAADTLVPRWYKIAAQIASIWILASTASVLVLTAGGFIYGYAIGDPVPLTRRG